MAIGNEAPGAAAEAPALDDDAEDEDEDEDDAEPDKEELASCTFCDDVLSDAGRGGGGLSSSDAKTGFSPKYTKFIANNINKNNNNEDDDDVDDDDKRDF